MQYYWEYDLNRIVQIFQQLHNDNSLFAASLSPSVSPKTIQKINLFKLYILFVSDDESGEKSVSVLLAGEESELMFIDFPTADHSVSIFFFEVFLSSFVDKMITLIQ